MKPYRIALIVSLACLLAAIVWVIWQRGGEERAAELKTPSLVDSSQNGGSLLTPDDQTPVQAPTQETPEASDGTEETPAKTKKASVQYNFQSWEDAMGAYAELAGLAYDKYKAQEAPEEAYAWFNALLEKDPDLIEKTGWTREKAAEDWIRESAVEGTFEKLTTEYQDLLSAMRPFLNDIPVWEWAAPNVLARAGRIPMSETQDLITLPNGEVIDWNEYRHPHKLVVKYKLRGTLTSDRLQLLADLEAKAADPSIGLTELERMELENLRAPKFAEQSVIYQRGDEGDPGFEEIIMDLGVIE